jgi:hypothetical protein
LCFGFLPPGAERPWVVAGGQSFGFLPPGAERRWGEGLAGGEARGVRLWSGGSGTSPLAGLRPACPPSTPLPSDRSRGGQSFGFLPQERSEVVLRVSPPRSGATLGGGPRRRRGEGGVRLWSGGSGTSPLAGLRPACPPSTPSPSARSRGGQSFGLSPRSGARLCFGFLPPGAVRRWGEGLAGGEARGAVRLWSGGSGTSPLAGLRPACPPSTPSPSARSRGGQSFGLSPRSGARLCFGFLPPGAERRWGEGLAGGEARGAVLPRPRGGQTVEGLAGGEARGAVSPTPAPCPS